MRPALARRLLLMTLLLVSLTLFATTLGAMRGIVHALRGWPTPLGVTLNTAGVSLFDSEGRCTDDAVQRALATVAEQALAFTPDALLRRHANACAQSVA